MRKLATALLLSLASTAFADVKLPKIFGDHMVLQRDKKVNVWGWADKGEQVTVTIGAAKATATTGDDGKWKVELDTLKASDQPVEVTVAGKNTIKLTDVLIGDVWVCSGQSNMQWALNATHNAKADIAAANRPTIRLFTVAHKIGFTPQDDCTGSWQVCTPENVKGFSAVAYFFGVEIQASQKVPIGLISTNWGGTVAQAWTSLEALQSTPATKNMATQFVDLRDNLEDRIVKYKAEALPKYEAALKKWEEDAAKAKEEGKKPPEKPKKPGSPDSSPNTPTVLYNAMIHPLLPLSIKGAIWYQGESNAGQAKQYQSLFPAMITDWRSRFGQGDFPFLWVQLANYLQRDEQPNDNTNQWAALREAQSMTLKLPNTGQAVIIDIGEAGDIHPRNKADVGKRLGLAGRAVAYGEKLVYSGPVYQSMTVEGDKIRIRFDHVGSGLTIGVAPPIRTNQEPAKPAGTLKGFAIAGADKKLVWADATIDGDTVVVSSPSVKEPVAVYYGWGNNPEVNLYNKEGLPASPFRTVSDEKK